MPSVCRCGCLTNPVDDEGLVRFRKRTGAGQAYATAVQVIGHCPSDTLAAAVEGLSMHGTPDGARLDICRMKVADQFHRGHAEVGLIRYLHRSEEHTSELQSLR